MKISDCGQSAGKIKEKKGDKMYKIIGFHDTTETTHNVFERELVARKSHTAIREGKSVLKKLKKDYPAHKFYDFALFKVEEVCRL